MYEGIYFFASSDVIKLYICRFESIINKLKKWTIKSVVLEH